jgi:transposase InsO family protein
MTSLKDLYYDAKTGFLSENKVYIKAKENGLKITHKEIKEFSDKQYTSQITGQDKRPKIFSSIYENKIRDNYQMDIIIYDRYEYHNYKYILVVVDIYSRYAQARAMTNRKNETIMLNLKDIIKVMGKPDKFSCDNEFATKEFEKYCNEYDIDVIFSEPNDIQKNSIVERLNRTIALMIQKYRVSTNKYNWYKILPDIIYNYNHSNHRTIKNTPDDIFNNNGKNNQNVYVVFHNLK